MINSFSLFNCFLSGKIFLQIKTFIKISNFEKLNMSNESNEERPVFRCGVGMLGSTREATEEIQKLIDNVI